MDLATIAALAGFVGNVGSGLASGLTQNNPQGYNWASNVLSGGQMAFNSAQSQLQRDWTERMWHMNNEYNDPSAMMQRLRAAGLNPALMYQGAGANMQASAATGGAESSASSSDALQRGLAGFSDFMQRQKIVDAQEESLLADAEYKRSQIPVNRQRVLNMLEEQKKLREEARKLGMENTVFEQSMPSNIEAIIAKNERTTEEDRVAKEYARTMAEGYARQLEAQINNIEAQTQKAISEGKLAEEKIKEVQANIANLKAQHRSLVALGEIDEYRAKHKSADFWTSHISNIYSAAALGLSLANNVYDEIKADLPSKAEFAKAIQEDPTLHK